MMVYPLLLIPGRMVVGLEVVAGILALRHRELVVFCRNPRYEVKQSFCAVSPVCLSFCVCSLKESLVNSLSGMLQNKLTLLVNIVWSCVIHKKLRKTRSTVYRKKF